MTQIFDDTRCLLGEGPLWHPERAELFWFDISGKKLFSRKATDLPVSSWEFSEHFSAAGWIDRHTLLLASETGLWEFIVHSGKKRLIQSLEANNPITRSNDGRADPWGGFWIGTMGKNLEPKAGSIYRFWKGEIRRLVTHLTIPNAICFSPDKKFAYYTDTPSRIIFRQSLCEASGWPVGEPESFINLNDAKRNPDGAVVDAEGCLWNAQWGSNCVARYSPEGDFLDEVRFPSSQISCPAFGGNNLSTLFATSAADGLAEDASAGCTFFSECDSKGQAEHRVIL